MLETPEVVINPGSIQAEVECNKDLEITLQKREFSIVGDNVYVTTSSEAPQWLLDLINGTIANAIAEGTTDFDDLRENILNAIAAMNIAKNDYDSYVIKLEDAEGRLLAYTETLNATVADSVAQIVSTLVTKVTADEALTIAVDAIQSSINGGAIKAQIDTINTTLATESLSRATQVDTIMAAITDENSGLVANASAIEILDATVIANQTANATWQTNLETFLETGDTTGTTIDSQSNIYSTLRSDITSAESKFGYDSTIIVNGNAYDSGFGIVSTGIPVGSYTDPNTGDQYIKFDSEFWIKADQFRVSSASNVGYTPFTIDGNNLVLNGTVKFVNTTGGTGSLQEVVQSYVGTVLYQTTAPTTGMEYGDYWLDTDSASYTVYRYQDSNGLNNGTLSWVVSTSTIATAIQTGYKAQSTANTANTLASTKIKTFYQSSVPTSSTAGDIWIDTDDGNKMYIANAANVNSIVTSGNGWYNKTLVVPAPELAEATITSNLAPTVSDIKNKGTIWRHTKQTSPALYDHYISQGNGVWTPIGGTYIDGSNIVTGTIDAQRIAALSITADKINTAGLIADNISGLNIYGKTITGGRIEGATITGAVIKTSWLDLTNTGYLTDWKYFSPGNPPPSQYLANFAKNATTGSLIIDSEGYYRLPKTKTAVYSGQAVGYVKHSYGTLYIPNYNFDVISYDDYTIASENRVLRARPRFAIQAGAGEHLILKVTHTFDRHHNYVTMQVGSNTLRLTCDAEGYFNRFTLTYNGSTIINTQYNTVNHIITIMGLQFRIKYRTVLASDEYHTIYFDGYEIYLLTFNDPITGQNGLIEFNENFTTSSILMFKDMQISSGHDGEVGKLNIYPPTFIEVYSN